MNKSEFFARFDGSEGKRRLIDALKDQKIVSGITAISEELCANGKLLFFKEGESLLLEGDWSNYIVFILAGKAEITITGFKIAERGAGQHVGEMALIDPAQPRSASVVAMEPTAGLVVPEETFVKIAGRYPDLWRQLAKEIAGRLRQRKKFVRVSNAVPCMFIACASESLPVAKALQAHFKSYDVLVEVWTDGVFKPSLGTFESLEVKLKSADFAVAIFSADDKVESRGEEKVAPRDNTVFELGLFAGAIGRERSFFAVQISEDIKVPSDLAGITSLRFRWPKNEDPDISEAGAQIRRRVFELGTR